MTEFKCPADIKLEKRIESLCKKSKPPAPGFMNILELEREIQTVKRMKSCIHDLHQEAVSKVFQEWFLMLTPTMQKHIIYQLRLHSEVVE